jgi:Arc/MetJ-type ribon-helix-helix transcriptional regulator
MLWICIAKHMHLVHDICMTKTNLQVRIPEEIDAEINKMAPASKSEFVREAIVEKLHRERFRRLEDQWIKSLQSHKDSPDEEEAWVDAEVWGDK